MWRLAPGVVIGAGAEIGDGTRHRARRGDRRPASPSGAIARSAPMSPSAMPMSATGSSSCPAPRSASPASALPPPGRAISRCPQLGRVIIQDDVEIGACTTIDRGALGDTVIGEGTKLDNLIMIAPQLPDRPPLRDRRPDRAGRQRGAGRWRGAGRAGGAGRPYPRRAPAPAWARARAPVRPYRPGRRASIMAGRRRNL